MVETLGSYKYPTITILTIATPWMIAQDLRLYRITILRRGTAFDVKVYEKNGNELIEKKKQTYPEPKAGVMFKLENAFPQQHLYIKSYGDRGKWPTNFAFFFSSGAASGRIPKDRISRLVLTVAPFLGSKLRFEAKVMDSSLDFTKGDFAWTTEDVGVAGNY
jgi:hypothetical protein